MIGTIPFWEVLARPVTAAIAVTLHGLILALIFRALGDRGPAQDGRVTLNPAAHLVMPTIASAIFARIAWPAPLDIDAGRLRGGRIAVLLPILGALFFSLALAWGAFALRGPLIENLPPEYSVPLRNWLTVYAQVTGWTVLANLLPLPPLTMGYLWALSPRLWAQVAPRRGQIGLVLVLLFSAAGYLGWLRPFAPTVAALLPS